MILSHNIHIFKNYALISFSCIIENHHFSYSYIDSYISVIKGEYIYSLAETLAISLIPASAALVGVANIKYFESIHISDIVYAHATVIRKIHSDYDMWVRITDNIDENVGKLKFKGKFILKGID